MSVCEKLIYLADYIDMSRKFEDCVRLRNAFWDAEPQNMSESQRDIHLTKILVTSFDMTLKALVEEHAPISDDTFKARNTLLISLCGEE